MKQFLQRTGLRVVIVLAILLLLTQVMPKRWYLGPEYLRWERVFGRIEELGIQGMPVTVVLGDSRSEMGINSCKLNANNLSLGGSSPVEGYYIYRKLLEKGLKIERIYLSYAPYHFQSQDCFHNRAGFFGFVDQKYIDEVLEYSKTQKDTIYQYKNWVWLDELDRQYPNVWVQRSLRYLPAIRSFGNYKKYFSTHEKIEKGMDANCMSYLFPSDSCPIGQAVYEVELENKFGGFYPNPVNAHYFRYLIKDIQSRGIQISWINMPLNEGSKHPSSSYYGSFENWLKSELPENVAYKPFGFQSACDFLDLSHLNERAANEFTATLSK